MTEKMNPKHIQQLKEGKPPMEYVPYAPLAAVARVMDAEAAWRDLDCPLKDCQAVQHSDQMVCDKCDQSWDANDPAPPSCAPAELPTSRGQI